MLFVFKNYIHKPNQLFVRKMCKPVFFFALFFFLTFRESKK